VRPGLDADGQQRGVVDGDDAVPVLQDEVVVVERKSAVGADHAGTVARAEVAGHDTGRVRPEFDVPARDERVLDEQTVGADLSPHGVGVADRERAARTVGEVHRDANLRRVRGKKSLRLR